MKKYSILFLLMVLCSSAFAQGFDFTDGAGTHHIGLNAGFSANPLRERSSVLDSTLSAVTRPYGLKVGFVYETTFIKGFGMQLGLNYTFGSSQGKWTDTPNSTIKKTKTDIYYHQIELPIDWQYKFEIAKQTYLILYTGPTLQMGLAFNQRTSVRDINPSTFKEETTSSSKDFYSKTTDLDGDGVYDYHRFNVTWGVGAGFQYKQYYLRGGYDFGICNPYNDRYFNHSISAYEFNRKGRQDQWSLKLGIYLWNF